MKKIGLLFSGQGAQTVGMGKSLYDKVPELKGLWDKANEVLGFNLAQICFEGPEELLTETRICQPALYVHGIAIIEALKAHELLKKEAVGVALGLSLGELTALAMADVYSFEVGLELVAKRGAYMQEACEASQGAMTSLIGGTIEEVKELCKEFEIDIANINCPGQIVISGEKEKINKATQKAKTLSFKRAIPLNVAGAYHSRLMKSAAEKFAQFIQSVTFNEPKNKVLSNYTGQLINTPTAIKEALVKQIISPVQWINCMEGALSEGIHEYFECGPGRVLKGLGKKINDNLKIHSISEWQDIDSFIANLTT